MAVSIHPFGCTPQELLPRKLGIKDDVMFGEKIHGLAVNINNTPVTTLQTLQHDLMTAKDRLGGGTVLGREKGWRAIWVGLACVATLALGGPRWVARSTARLLSTAEACHPPPLPTKASRVPFTTPLATPRRTTSCAALLLPQGFTLLLVERGDFVDKNVAFALVPIVEVVLCALFRRFTTFRLAHCRKKEEKEKRKRETRENKKKSRTKKKKKKTKRWGKVNR